jgi:hypothetical protein
MVNPEETASSPETAPTPPPHQPRLRMPALPPRPAWIRALPLVGIVLLVPALTMAFFLKKQFLVQELAYTSKEGRFRVVFPATPGNLEADSETDQTDLGPIEFHWVGRDSTNKFHWNACCVGYHDLPEAHVRKTPVEAVLDDCLDGFRDRENKFTIVSKRSIQLGPYPGLEATARLMDNKLESTGIFRAYLAGCRVYWLEFHQPVDAKQVDPAPFFNSFEILKP